MFQWGFDQGIVDGFWDGFWNSLTAPLQTWLSQYPGAAWLLANPGWLIVAVVVALFLLSGLLRAVAGLTEQLWLGLLRLPFQLVRWVWQGSLFLLRRPFAKPPQAVQSSLMVQPDSPTEPRSERLTEVLERLESLRREQDELMQEMKLLLTDGRQKQS